MLPYTTAVAAPRAPGSDGRIARALGRDGMPAAAAIDAFARELGAPRSLRELGLSDGDLQRAIDLVDDTLGRLAEPVLRSESEALLSAAFEGRASLAETVGQ
jgi:maleylacetate reductase